MNVTRYAILAFVLGAAVACGPPSRDGAVKQTAKKVCKRYDQCDTLEDNYSSYDECITDWEDTFYDAWTEDRCNNDIDPEQLDECQVQIETFDCDGGAIQAFGLLAGSCSANQVCSN